MSKIKSISLRTIRMFIDHEYRDRADVDLWGNSRGYLTKCEAKKLIAWLEKWVNEN